ncbi:hypothetical protein [Kosmotoga pacifica]|uniref:Uncharacterized protein n=1 Tax=Kosmotoga pacifica TaxID=1330330 RepID=A0A0G2Z7R9_9BACT|nr:hypothetical protein [Kosmotoga pacifica]AKI97645.1 hypothetical protein IX53_07255 [Kosmotoga pacifica]
MKKIDRRLLPCVEIEGTVVCSCCSKVYEVERKQKLNSIVITVCPHCGHENISVITNSINYIEEVTEKLKKLQEELKGLRESLEIEYQEKGCIDDYPESYCERNNTAKPKLL